MTILCSTKRSDHR